MSTNHPQEIMVRVSSADERLWEGCAQSVSSENQSGRFDILPGHANFITMIEQNPITVRTAEGEKTFEYPNAVVYVSNGSVEIFAGI